jgi:KaiC/GvpD/RAD55 family RecA-like ATPase
MEKIKTYIPRLDKALDGGIPKHSVILVEGPPGTYKSSLVYSLIYKNAIHANRKSLYISLEQRSGSLLKQFESMGFLYSPVRNRVTIMDMATMRKKALSHAKDWMTIIKNAIRSLWEHEPYELLALDSLAVLEVLAGVENKRKDLFDLFEFLRDMDITAFVIQETKSDAFTDEEFMVDGIIKLRKVRVSGLEYQIHLGIEKMRFTSHPHTYYVLLFEDGEFAITTALREEEV